MSRAIVCIKNGDPTLPVGQGVLELKQDWQPPKLKPGHIRIAVVAASVNYADPLAVKGQYQVKFKLPYVPGSEASGIVEEVGPGVKSLKPGDKVVALMQAGGAYAEQAVVPGICAWKLPDGVDFAVAAATPVAYGTADLALRHRAQLKAGQTVLVLGAGGGVGVAAVQIAKAAGAQVIAVTQGAAKVAFLKDQGADVVIDLDHVQQGKQAAAAAQQQGGAQKPQLHQVVKQHAPRGVHVVIDPVGGPYFNEAMKAVTWGAHVVVIGFAAGGIPQIPANILLVKNTTVHGLYWGSYMEHHPQVLKQSMDDLFRQLASGQLRPHVSHRFALDQVPNAFATLLGREAMGKVVVMVREGQHSSSGGNKALLASKL